jgi:GntR family transcriptional regulator of vanillate catabolism
MNSKEHKGPIPISRESSQTARAVLGLRDAVLRGRFQAGQRLSEVEVAEHLGVSRTPVRAAMQRLAEEGLLESVQPTGYVVRAFSEADIDDAIEVRGTIEALAARLAAERGVTSPVLHEMKDCLARIDAVFSDGSTSIERLQRYATANERFHVLLMEASGSGMVQRALARVVSLPFASPNAFVLAEAQLPGSFEILKTAQMQHHDIVDAIEARAGARVEALVKEHSRIARKNLQLALRHGDAFDHVVGASLIRRHNAASGK